MQKGLPLAILVTSIPKTAVVIATGLAFSLSLAIGCPASAQNASSTDPQGTRAWAPGAIEQARKMRIHQDIDHGSQPTPAIIPRFEVDADPSGKVATLQPGGPTFTRDE